jgi:hypothetical protein
LKKIKIGFLLNGNFVDKYNYELAKWIKKDNKKFISTSFISIPSNKKKLSYKKIPKKILFKFLVLIEFFLLKIINRHINHIKKYDLSKIIKKKIEIKNTSDHLNYINKKDFNKIKDEKFDIIIRANDGILKGEILKCSKFGVISFHHGDYTKYRGGPAGFWEVFLKEKNTGFIIQKIDSTLDYGRIILEGFFQTKSFFLLNQAELYEKSNFYFKRFLLDLYKNRKLSFIKKKRKGKIFETPKIINQIKYIFQTFKLLVKKAFYDNYQFKLALFNLKKISLPTIYNNQTKNFLADPFLVKHKSQTYCFAEEYDYGRKMGHIICIDLKKNTRNIVLKENFHLSFPFIFTYKNKFFMCPETSQISEIRLYECVKFPLKWKFYKTIKKKINSADNIIFKKNNLWWLFTNIDQSNSQDHTHDLSIFYSNSGPLTHKWKSHSLNPIKINSSESRNAGIIIEKNKITRISQTQGFDNYGESINFHKIKTLSINKYNEEIISNKQFIKIKKNLNNAEIHHFSKVGDNVMVDFK